MKTIDKIISSQISNTAYLHINTDIGSIFIKLHINNCSKREVAYAISKILEIYNKSPNEIENILSPLEIKNRAKDEQQTIIKYDIKTIIDKSSQKGHKKT